MLQTIRLKTISTTLKGDGFQPLISSCGPICRPFRYASKQMGGCAWDVWVAMHVCMCEIKALAAIPWTRFLQHTSNKNLSEWSGNGRGSRKQSHIVDRFSDLLPFFVYHFNLSLLNGISVLCYVK